MIPPCEPPVPSVLVKLTNQKLVVLPETETDPVTLGTSILILQTVGVSEVTAQIGPSVSRPPTELSE